MYCPNCGKKVKHEKFCNNCGYDLVQKRSRFFAVKILTAVIVAVIIIGGCGFFYFSNKNSDSLTKAENYIYKNYLNIKNQLINPESFNIPFGKTATIYFVENTKTDESDTYFVLPYSATNTYDSYISTASVYKNSIFLCEYDDLLDGYLEGTDEDVSQFYLFTKAYEASKSDDEEIDFYEYKIKVIDGINLDEIKEKLGI